MKKFRYRLERVLDFRNAERKEKERALAVKNAELHSAEERLDEIIVAQDRAVLPTEQELTMAEVILQREFQQGLRVLLERQRKLIEEATEAVNEARDAYLEKAVAAESLVSHREKRFDEWRDDKRRAERKLNDDLTIMRVKRSR